MVHVGERIFHTPPNLAELMTSLLPDGFYNNVADICCGSWTLLKAVRKRWTNINITGVDLDPRAEIEKPKGSYFKLMDGREYANNCLKSGIYFDLVVANPPFGKAERYVLEQLQIPSIWQVNGFASTRIEAQMMIANAILVRPGGYLVAIVPSSFIEAESFKEFRENLTNFFHVRTIIRLPSYTFKSRGIRSYIIVLRKKISSIDNFNETTYCLTASIEESFWKSQLDDIMPSDFIKNGVWTKVFKNGIGIQNINIFRGRISCSQFSDKGVPILHTSTIPKKGQVWTPKKKFVELSQELKKMPKATDGDIIISRVGKSAGYWYVYSGSDILISDCLIVLKSKNQNLIINLFHKNSHQGCLKHLVKGLTTQYITKNDLNFWITSDENAFNLNII